MKKIKLQAVDRPQVEFDCVGESVKSPYIASAKKNPNFPEPWAYFDLVTVLFYLTIIAASHVMTGCC